MLGTFINNGEKRVHLIPDAATPKIELSLCVHAGDMVHQQSKKKYYVCDRGHGVVCPCKECKSCPEYAQDEPKKVLRIDSSKLIQSEGGRHFNASMIRWRGRWIMAYRMDWRSSRIAIAYLDESFVPVSNHPVDIDHPFCTLGQEDPRLFVHNDKLMLSFSGLREGGINSHVMLAELNPIFFSPLKVWYAHYPSRTQTEKNWVFFSSDGELFCVYSTYPKHTILRVGEVAIEAYSTPTKAMWQVGLVRGGASPVQKDGQWHHFFHGWRNLDGFYTYSLGVCCFELAAPFRVTRMSIAPIATADQRCNPMDEMTKTAAVLFPSGASFENGIWRISCGHHDRWIEIMEFSESQIEDVLEDAT